MIKNTVVVLFICLLCFTGFSQGLNSGPLNIAYVDLDKIMSESEVIRKSVEDVQDEINEEREAIAEKLTRFKVLSESLEQQSTILSEKQKKTRRDEIEELKMTIEDQQDKINRMIRRSEREIVEPTLKRVEETINAVGKEIGFDLILRSDTVLYASERVDITDMIIRRIDEKGSLIPDISEETISDEQKDISTEAISGEEREVIPMTPTPTPWITPTPTPTSTPTPTPGETAITITF